MEFTHDQLIDVGLNLAGYMAASLFALVIYSIYFGRKIANLEDAVRCAAGWTESPGFNELGVQSKSRGSSDSRLDSSSTDKTVSDSDAARAEFLDLRPAFHSESAASEAADNYYGNPERHSRNRSEVIRLARKMLEAGNTADRVSDLLPISESEMRLVQMSAEARSTQA